MTALVFKKSAIAASSVMYLETITVKNVDQGQCSWYSTVMQNSWCSTV